MAEKLLLYYNYLNEIKGAEGTFRLASITKIPISMAAIEPDTPKNINAFKDAIKIITGKSAPKF